MASEGSERGSSRSNDDYCCDVSKNLFTGERFPHNLIVRPPVLGRISAADMDDWSPLRILFRLAQYFMGYRGRVAFAECNIFH